MTWSRHGKPRPPCKQRASKQRRNREPDGPNGQRSLQASSIASDTPPGGSACHFWQTSEAGSPYFSAAAFIASPLRRERQEDGRIRFWGRISLSGEAADRILRVITLEDGETIHNAFLDSHLPRGRAMKMHYYPDTDSLYVEFKREPSVETREIADGLNVDLDAQGNVVGFDIDHAAERLELATLETQELPVRAYKAG